MTVLKIKKTSHFSTYQNALIQTNKMSFKSKGFLVYLLSLPHDWNVKIETLCDEFSEGKAFFYACIKELKSLGYITHQFIRDETGRVIKGEYIVSEDPSLLDSDFRNPVKDTSLSLESENRDIANQDSARRFSEKKSAYKYKETKETKETKNTKKTAATKAPLAVSCQNDDLLAAAPLEIIQNGKLNDAQVKRVEQVVTELFPASVYDLKVRELIVVLEDSNAFTKSGNLFYKKLNTIKKQIQSGQWRSPIVKSAAPGATQKVISAMEVERKKMMSELISLQQQKQSFERGMNEERFKNRPEYILSCEKMIASLNADIARISNYLMQLTDETESSIQREEVQHVTTH